MRADTLRHPSRWILALTLVIAGCSYARIEGVLVDEQPARTYEGVTVWRGGSLVPASHHMALMKDDIIETDGRTALVIRFTGGNEILMEPETKVRLGSVWTFFGKVIAKVKDAFAVETDYGAAGTTSTLYIVQADSSGLFEVTVLEGRVDVKLKKDRGQPVRQIQAGEHFTRRMIEGSLYVGVGKIEGVRELDTLTRNRFRTALKVVVPNLIGMSESDARRLLRNEKLDAQVEYRHTGEFAPSTVIEQRPGAGLAVDRGALVILTVEKASLVPGLVGQTYDAAQRAVKMAGLTMGPPKRVVGRDPGRIVSQSPPPGASVAPGTVIGVDVAAVQLPGVLQWDQNRALKVMQQYGLRPTIRWQGPKGGDAVVIVGQDPKPGTLMLPGEAVTLTVQGRIN